MSVAPRVSVVVPAYNEAAILPSTVEHLVSGRMARFESVPQLVDCLIRLLAEAQAA